MMSLKSLVAVFAVVIMGSVGFAAEVKWTGAGADDSWFTADNWEGGVVPGPADIVILNPPPGRGPVISGDASCGSIRGPVWKSGEPQVVDIKAGRVRIGGEWRFANRGDGVGTINISGGDVTIDGYFRWSDSGGTFGIVNISGSGSVRCDGIAIGDGGGGEIHVSEAGFLQVAGMLNLGGSRGHSPLLIEMTGGEIRIGGQFKCPANEDRAGLTTVRLKAGSIHCGSFSHANVKYSMDIEQGQFTIKGNVTDDIREDIAAGYITSYGGKEKVLCKYDETLGRTIVRSSVQKTALNPFPANRAVDVRPDVVLKWDAAPNAAMHKVYIGTSLDALKKGTVLYTSDNRGQVRARLDFGKTYYWRVDTVDGGGKTAEGVVWRFSTTSGRTSEPVPADGAVGVAPDVRLKWKPSLVAKWSKVYIAASRQALEGVAEPKNVTAAVLVEGNSFKPSNLELGKTYYWRVDAIDEKWPQSPWIGDVWSFTVDTGKARDPQPMDKGQWVATTTQLKWRRAKNAVAERLYFGGSAEAVADAAKPVAVLRGDSSYKVSGLAEAGQYYWRVDEVYASGKVVKGDVWRFSTVGVLDLKVDLAVPQWEDRTKPVPGTAKPGWVIWASERWADMYMHNGVWFPTNDVGETPDPKGILGSGVCVKITTGGGGTGTVHCKGMCRGNLAGDLRPYGKPQGDPIANTYFYACDWGGPKIGDALLILTGLPPGEYELVTYHNHWEPCKQETRNCHDCDCGMPPMPSVTANPLVAEALEGYRNLSVPLGSGRGVIALKNEKNVKVTSVYDDDKVSRSTIKFATDGSPVLVIYEAPDNGYPDCARSGREGGRGIVNAFELKLVDWHKSGR